MASKLNLVGGIYLYKKDVSPKSIEKIFFWKLLEIIFERFWENFEIFFQNFSKFSLKISKNKFNNFRKTNFSSTKQFFFKICFGHNFHVHVDAAYESLFQSHHLS
jgi:hypothetical protein